MVLLGSQINLTDIVFGKKITILVAHRMWNTVQLSAIRPKGPKGAYPCRIR